MPCLNFAHYLELQIVYFIKIHTTVYWPPSSANYELVYRFTNWNGSSSQRLLICYIYYVLFGTKQNISFRMTTYVDMWIALNQDCGNVIISKYHMLSGRYYVISRWYVGTSLSQDFTRLNRMSEGNVGLCEWYLMLRWCYTLSARCSIHMIQVLYMRWCAIWYGVTLYQDCVIRWYGIGLERYDISYSCFHCFATHK